MEEINLSESILESVKADIDKSLPREVGDSLKKRLERCDELEIETKDQKTEIKNLEEVVETKDSVILDLEKKKKALENKLKDIETRELDVENKLKDIETRERNLKITLLETQLASSQQSKNDIYNLTEKVFGLPSVKVERKHQDFYDNQCVSKHNPSTQYYDSVYEDVKTGESHTETTTSGKDLI